MPARRRLRLLAPAAALLLALLAYAGWLALPGAIAARLRGAAAARGWTATWRSLEVRPPVAITLRGLVLTAADSDTAVAIDSLGVALAPASLLTGAPRPSRLVIAGASITPPSHPDTLAGDVTVTRPGRRPRPDRLPRIRDSGRRLARALMSDPGTLAATLRDVTVYTRGDSGERHTLLRLDAVDLGPAGGVVRLVTRGTVVLEDPTPFTADITYAPDGRLTGAASFTLVGGAVPQRLPVAIDARLRRDGSPRALRLAPGSTVTVGPIALRVTAALEPAAPHATFALEAHGVRPAEVAQRLPAALLGPLAGLRLAGTFDYALAFDLDFERPDSVAFDADVVSHGLAIQPGSPLDPRALARPFTARIHLPRDVVVTRELTDANPHFRTLDAIDPAIGAAVVTNEDGGFFRHRGFNTRAVRDAIAENLRAGAYRRGAGTITMQLARNLYLGHERTLARKAQEVVLAWVIEHLAGVTKERLLEIYLNIIEWGPGVHGADEACQYYFGHDAGRVTVDEALFLATVVPAPTKWRYRFDRDGRLRPFERAQMHFIGRAMAAKGWLDPAALPPADSLAVELRGRARDVLFPPAIAGPKLQEADSGDGTITTD